MQPATRLFNTRITSAKHSKLMTLPIIARSERGIFVLLDGPIKDDSFVTAVIASTPDFSADVRITTASVTRLQETPGSAVISVVLDAESVQTPAAAIENAKVFDHELGREVYRSTWHRRVHELARTAKAEAKASKALRGGDPILAHVAWSDEVDANPFA